MRNGIVSWSGGKDSCFALHKAFGEGLNFVAALNMMNENGEFSRSHAIPLNILEAQALALGIPIFTVPASWQEYEAKYIETLKKIKARFSFSEIVFGDIDLEPHREWEEKVANSINVKATLPLWQQNRRELVMQMIHFGIEAIIVSCNDTMGPDFLGRRIDEPLINELEAIGVDACGENGEYHTLVVDCPLFNQRIDIKTTSKLKHGNYNFLEFELA